MPGYARPTPKLARWEDVIGVRQRARDAAGAAEKSPREAQPLIAGG
jgi:hypothetical protein